MPTTSSTVIFKRGKKKQTNLPLYSLQNLFSIFQRREKQIWPEVWGNRHGDWLVFILLTGCIGFCFFVFFFRVWEQRGVAGVEWAWLNGIWGWMGKWLHRIKSGTPLAWFVGDFLQVNMAKEINGAEKERKREYKGTLPLSLWKRIEEEKCQRRLGFEP